MTFGLGEPKVSHSSEAFWPSRNVYVVPSSLRIWAGSSETAPRTKRSEPRDRYRHSKSRMCETLTNDIDVRVDEDGPVDVGGLALIDGSVGEVDIL